jgi:hypothetical protein
MLLKDMFVGFQLPELRTDTVTVYFTYDDHIASKTDENIGNMIKIYFEGTLFQNRISTTFLCDVTQA